MTRTGTPVRTARLMSSRIISLVEYPAGDRGGPSGLARWRAGVDDAVGSDPGPLRPLTAAGQPVQLTRRVRVGVDREQTARLDGDGQQPVRGFLALGAAVDLDRDVVLATGREHLLRIELRLRLAAAEYHPARAVAEHVHPRIGDRGDHAAGHLRGGHPQFGMHAGDHDVQPGEQVVALIERAVIQDVDLDASQDAERRELGIQPAQEVELLFQPFRRRGRWPRLAAASGR